MNEQLKLDKFFLIKDEREIKRDIPEIGEKGSSKLPKGWKLVRLGDLVLRVQYGISKAMNTEGVGYPIIRMNNITYDGQLDLTELKYVNIDEKTAKKYILSKGDLLFNRTNSKELVGKTAVFNQDGEFVFASYIIRVVIDPNKALPEYVCAFLNSKEGKEILFKMARPAVQMANINAKELCRIKIPLAPLEEQKRIVTRVEKLRSKIKEARRLRKLAKEETEKIMQAALHKVFSRAEEKGWKWVKIKDVVEEFQSGFACSKVHATESGIPHLRPNNIGFWGELDLTELVFIPPEMVDLDKYSLKKGDVLFNNTNSKELVGRACIVREDLNYGFSNHITRLRVNKKLITPEWLVSSINYLWLRGYFLAICRKWIGQAGVNMTMLKNTKIPLPSLEEQKQIATYLDKLSKTIKSLKKLQQSTDEELEKLVPAILDKAFKGRL